VKIVERLSELNINILFIIGGDGTLRGAGHIASEAHRRNHAISIVGIPKTIDNDIMFTDKSFGYETACAAAVQAIRVAHTEACTVRNGVGIVKLMGRHSGFIACSAALAHK
jgi:6-phosphofructokinase 1